MYKFEAPETRKALVLFAQRAGAYNFNLDTRVFSRQWAFPSPSLPTLLLSPPLGSSPPFSSLFPPAPKTTDATHEHTRSTARQQDGDCATRRTKTGRSRERGGSGGTQATARGAGWQAAR